MVGRWEWGVGAAWGEKGRGQAVGEVVIFANHVIFKIRKNKLRNKYYLASPQVMLKNRCLVL